MGIDYLSLMLKRKTQVWIGKSLAMCRPKILIELNAGCRQFVEDLFQIRYNLSYQQLSNLLGIQTFF